MPFGEGFDEIFGLFIAGAIDEAGFEVVRADDIRNQQNILKDVVAGINESALVVADLTGGNANVFYELGLAHGLGKRVILITQSVDELPFDLRSYRVIPYSTHFADIATARSALVSVATDALQDRIAFGSPVTDFLTAAARSDQATVSPQSLVNTEGDEAGILDHLVNLEEGFETLSQVVNTITSEMTSMADVTASTSERLKSLAASSSPAHERRAVVIALATRLSTFANSLSGHNTEYARALASARSGLEWIIRAQAPSTDTEKDQLRTFLSQLDDSEKATMGQRTALAQLIKIIRSSPRVERTYNRAADEAVRHLEGYAQNVDQALSMIVRARELTRNRLGETAG